jgi:CelD/BcsL family acetyltransferase involved in cellulose biosynthesis
MAISGELQTGTITVHAEVGGLEAIERLAPEWRRLCMKAANDEPFYRPEWIGAWLQAFHPGRDLIVVTAYVGDRLTGVLPLIEKKGFVHGLPVRKLSGAANVHSCRFDILREAGPEGDATVLAIWQFIRDRSKWDLIKLPDVPQGGSGELLLEAARKDGFLTGQWETIRSPYIPLTDVKGAVFMPRKAQFRRNVRRRLSKAQAQFEVGLRSSKVADTEQLERFYQLERRGWKGREGSAIACSATTRLFYDQIARAAESFGYFSLYLLEFGDQVVAGHFGLIYGGRYYCPKVAYDENYAAYGPGHLIVDAILRECLQNGLREFDFLGPSMDWKSEWTEATRKHSHCYVFRNGLFGKMLYLARFRVLATARHWARHPAVARLHQNVQTYFRSDVS